MLNLTFDVGMNRTLPILSIRLAVAAAAASLAFFIAGCETNQIKPPIDTNAVIWTQLTHPSGTGALEPLFPDWRDSTIAFNYTEVLGPVVNFHIGLVKQDGSGVTLFREAGPTRDVFARWVNDTILVYSSNKGGNGHYLIWYRNLSSGLTINLRGVLSLDSWQPTPRPGLPSLVYTDGPNYQQGRIALIPDTAAVSEIFLTPDTLKAGEPDWDPAGNRLCFTADDPSGARNLWLMTLSGTSVVSMRRLTTEGVHDVNPRFSPDGTKIVFRSDRSGKSGVWWVSPDSAQMAPRLIAFEDVERTIVSPAWSPNGMELVVSSGARSPPSLLEDDRALFILSNLGF